jgi:hypothetical protein
MMMIQKRDSYSSKHIRTLFLSTNVNDYDTGGPIVDGSVTKSLTNSSSHKVDNPLFSELNGIKVGRKYYPQTTSRNTLVPDDCSKHSNRQQSLLLTS